MSGFLADHGHWDQYAALHQTALTAARQAGDRLGEADTLAQLGILQRQTGNYPAAATSLAQAVALYGDAGDLSGRAYALNRLGFLRVLTGDYRAAAASHEQALALARSASDRLAESATLLNLGLLQQLAGDYQAAATRLQRARRRHRARPVRAQPGVAQVRWGLRDSGQASGLFSQQWRRADVAQAHSCTPASIPLPRAGWLRRAMQRPRPGSATAIWRGHSRTGTLILRLGGRTGCPEGAVSLVMTVHWLDTAA